MWRHETRFNHLFIMMVPRALEVVPCMGGWYLLLGLCSRSQMVFSYPWEEFGMVQHLAWDGHVLIVYVCSGQSLCAYMCMWVFVQLHVFVPPWAPPFEWNVQPCQGRINPLPIATPLLWQLHRKQSCIIHGSIRQQNITYMCVIAPLI